jgi:hypothetical protein
MISLRLKFLSGIAFFFAIIATSIFGIIFCAEHRFDGCVEYKCHYMDHILNGSRACIVKIIQNNVTIYSCEYPFQYCPSDKSSPCFIYYDYYCPLINGCSNSSYIMGLTISSIFLIIMTICLILFVIYNVRRLEHFEVSG